MQMPMLTAPLAGVPSGLQAQGVWAGRRQLFVRFASEAETATMYRADALAREIDRSVARSAYHSIAITGRDALANLEFLTAVLAQVTSPLPVMLDTDGHAGAALGALVPRLTLVQVTLDIGADGPTDATGPIDGACAALAAAAEGGCAHALVLTAREEATDARLLQSVEQAHAASVATMIVVHPGTAVGERLTLDRRWATFAEQATAVHGDVRIALRLPGPAAMR